MAELPRNDIQVLIDRCSALEKLISGSHNPRLIDEYQEQFQDTRAAIRMGAPLPRQTVEPVISAGWNNNHADPKQILPESDRAKAGLNESGGKLSGDGRWMYIEGSCLEHLQLKKLGLAMIVRGLISQNSLSSISRCN